MQKMSIGERIKQLRKKSGITQSALAEKLHVSGSTISQYENDEIKITIDNFIKIANIFNVPLDYLAGFIVEVKKEDAMKEDVTYNENEYELRELKMKVNALENERDIYKDFSKTLKEQIDFLQGIISATTK